jgi:FtsP/CotA-like multicopper oxidase with cupredoxin domain
MTFNSTLGVAIGAAILMSSLGGCGTPAAPVSPPADIPSALRAPADQVAYLEALAAGVQVYECAPKANDAAAFEWVFRAPEAGLVDRSGRALGKHYAGPTWESTDGSTVVGEVKARDPGPSPSAIPWLLLGAKSVTGPGVFGATTSIQRVQTAGGIAPKEPCAASNAKQVVRVPYTATYVFYRAAK